jgi:hypothetical protein
VNGHDNDELVDRLLEMEPGEERDELLTRLPSAVRIEIEPLLTVGDLAWESQFVAPPVDQDPIAAMLGLVPDPAYRLDPGVLARARKARRMTVGDLADQLTRRGWSTRGKDVFGWESSGATLPPATVQAIAELLDVTTERLTGQASPGTSPSPFTSTQPAPQSTQAATAAAARVTPRFQAVAARYAALVGLKLSEASDALVGRMLATAHRGAPPDQEQMLSSIEALVEALERRADQATDSSPRDP